MAPHPETFDAAVVATPASQAARLLGGPAGEGLAGVESASVAVVTMAFDGGVVPPPGVNGFLVPRGQGRLMTACSFGSRKWPHWAAPGIEVVRLSAGRAGDDPATGHQALDDDVLTGRLAEELAAALGADLPSPVAVRVSRWPDSFPQYPPGHLRRIEAVEDALAKSAPAVVLAGSAYRGAGIPACIASGRRAARLALGRAGPP